MDGDLGDRISDQSCKNTDDRWFVPADAVDGLAPRDVIKKELEGKTGNVPLSSLVDYVLNKPAIKVFLTLAYCYNMDAMVDIYRSGLCDEHLPIEQDIANSTKQVSLRTLNANSTSQPDWTPIIPWGGRRRREFLDRQWLFLAPVFTMDQFIYTLLSKQCPLPITNTKPGTQGGLSGSVNEVEVHPAHQKVLKKENGESLRVALKTIRPQMGHYFQQEEETLAVIREIKHPHLIKPIASYRYNDEDHGYFLFPWAEGGNLRQFWAKEVTRPLKNRRMMMWVLEQLRGLCHALSILHDRGHRHGDLKPENILLFDERHSIRTLQIADVGLARFHKMDTQQRKDLMQKTKTMTGTIRYVSPEFVQDVIPRVFDVWALGCVFVEFLIWMLYGNNQLDEFNGDSFDHYWEKQGSEFIVHSSVQPWLNRLSEDLRGSETGLAGLLTMVKTEMLVPKESDRSSSDEVYETLAKICDRAAKEPEYLLDSRIWAKISTRSLPSTKISGTTLAVPGSSGKSRPPLPQHQDSTSDPREHKEIPIMIHEAKDDDEPAGDTENKVTTIPTTIKIAQDFCYRKNQLRRLNGVWHSQIDNDFARGLFARKDWSSNFSPEDSSTPCHVCSSFDISLPGFQISDLLDDINARSKECKLCTMFSEAAADYGLSGGDKFVCQRIESTLRLQPGGQTILSIYSDPESTWASQGAQIGPPLLPEPGGLAQFALMNEWLRICREKHNHGQPVPKAAVHSDGPKSQPDAPVNKELPTRIIDVGDRDNPKLHIINREAMESQGAQDYIALSHCWGQGPMFCALTANIDSLRKAIDPDLLPRSFQDAVTVTRGLNVRYLWIDSLCIIQDDKKDWDHEAARMQLVFSNAICVLAASSAASSAEGFLKSDRQQRSWVTLRSPSGATRHVCKYIDNFHRDVEEAPLNKRGWVLQERALARRTIHFTSTQLYLECGNGVHCESLTKLANWKAAFLGDSDFPNSVLPYYKGGRIILFQDLFGIYSRLGFSEETDRSIAISGLERRLMSVFKSKGGYGIFDTYLERSLLWVRPEGSSLKPIPYPPDRNVPSWSWMAYEGGVSYLEAPFDTVKWTNDYESPFQSDGNKQYWEANESNNATPVLKSKMGRRFPLDQSSPDIAQNIMFDLDTKIDRLDGYCCIVLGKEKSDGSRTNTLNYVLVIAPSPSKQPNAFVRVGVGALLDSQISWTSEEYVEVT
ncbi:Fc.00g001410.m01.CDS01 [Cosmosporella sp. VM-42]